MSQIGQLNRLRIVKEVSFGLYLDGGKLGEILLPNKVVPKTYHIGDEVEVFIYFDSNDKLIATTVRPNVFVGECACLTVVDVNAVGAFLDWGLDKDLLVPKSEQQHRMMKGQSYIVHVKQDNQDRMIGSSKMDSFLDRSPPNYQPAEAVSLLIAEPTLLGHKVIINNRHWGLVYTSDIFTPLVYGKSMQGFIKTVRDDGKIDVVLRKIGQDSIHALMVLILEKLTHAGGFLPLHDKSSALVIKETFNESKNHFKQAIGQLYKRGEILIEDNGIRLIMAQN